MKLSLKDHPRLRGKDFPSIEVERMILGSPPLTRERPYSTGAGAAPPRITPAYAGKTPSPGPTYTVDEDHPRLRGKDVCINAVASFRAGSPPLTRERHRYGTKVEE